MAFVWFLPLGKVNVDSVEVDTWVKRLPSSLTGGWRMKTREVRCHCNGWWSTRRCFPCGWRVEIRKKAPERISVQNPASDGDKLRSSTGAEFCQSLVFSIMWIQVFCMHLKYQDVFHSIFAGRFLPPAFFEQPDVVVMRDKTTWATKNIQQKSGKSPHFPPISSSPFFHRKKYAEFFLAARSTRPR